MSSIGNRMDHRHTDTRQQVLHGLMVVVSILLLVWLLVQWQRREPPVPAPAPHTSAPVATVTPKVVAAAPSAPPVPKN